MDPGLDGIEPIVETIGPVVECKSSGFVVTVAMAWSPAWRSNAK